MDGRLGTVAQVLAHPADAFAAHDVVGVDHGLDAQDRGEVATDHYDGIRGKLAHQAAHLAHLAYIDDDR
jgi:hypothetical protein